MISPLALNHFENLPVLGHLYPIGALGELIKASSLLKSGSARQRRAHSVSVEKDHVQAIPVPQGHRALVTV